MCTWQKRLSPIIFNDVRFFLLCQPLDSFYFFPLVFISQLPAYFSVHKMLLPLHPEVSIILKDGGARSDGHSDAATKPATVRLQTGPAEERGEPPCGSSATAPPRRLGGAESGAEADEAVAFAG